MEHKYIVVQSMYKNGDITRISFGIAAVEEYDGVTTILESISDISTDIEPIERSARKAATDGGLPRNVGQTTFCVKGLHRFAKMKPKFTDGLFLP